MLVFAMLLIVYSSVRQIAEAKWLVFAWIAAGTFTAGRGLAQYAADVAGAKAAHRNFYEFYIADRIRGFMSHWMTFSGQELFVLLFAVAFLLFGPSLKRWAWFAIPSVGITSLALVLGDTRSIWAAAVVAGFYLLWMWESVLRWPCLWCLRSGCWSRRRRCNNARIPSLARRSRQIPTSTGLSSGGPASP